MKTNSQGFVNQILFCVLLTIFGGGSIGLGTVWMRQQITHTAKINRDLAARLADIERQLAELNVSIEAAQSHDELRRRNDEWRLGLVPSTDAQMIHVEMSTAQLAHRMAVRAHRELLQEAPPPGRVTFALGR